jgi:hypothetical protein
MRTDERWGDEPDDSAEPNDPSWASPYVDGAWGRTANPNTADGELQNIAAFGAGLTRLNGPRRTLAAAVVWAILFGFALAIIAGVVGIVSIL